MVAVKLCHVNRDNQSFQKPVPELAQVIKLYFALNHWRLIYQIYFFEITLTKSC